MPQSRSRWRISSKFAAAFVLIGSLAAAQSFPKSTGRVNDFAEVIDAGTEAELDRMIDQLEKDTSAEIAVATVSSLDGTSVEDYANRLFKEWGVGRAKEDNGVLVLVAPSERKMRIEVGYGLEGVLPDGLAGQIIRDDFTPRFRDNDYNGGIKNGVTHITEVVRAHQVLTPEEVAKLNGGGSDNGIMGDTYIAFFAIPFFGLFVAIGFGMLGLGVRTKTGFPVLFGGFFGGMPLLMSLVFLGRLSLLTLFPFGAFMCALGYHFGGRPSWRNAFRNSGNSAGGASSSGWTMGASSSSGSSSSDSSSSSSDFGGGSSGGGGASGSW